MTTTSNKKVFFRSLRGVSVTRPAAVQQHEEDEEEHVQEASMSVVPDATETAAAIALSTESSPRICAAAYVLALHEAACMTACRVLRWPRGRRLWECSVGLGEIGNRTVSTGTSTSKIKQ